MMKVGSSVWPRLERIGESERSLGLGLIGQRIEMSLFVAHRKGTAVSRLEPFYPISLVEFCFSIRNVISLLFTWKTIPPIILDSI